MAERLEESVGGGDTEALALAVRLEVGEAVAEREPLWLVEPVSEGVEEAVMVVEGVARMPAAAPSLRKLWST